MSTNPTETRAGNPHYRTPSANLSKWYNPAFDDYLHSAFDRLVNGEVELISATGRREDIERAAFSYLSSVPVEQVVAIGSGLPVDIQVRGSGHCG